MREEHVCAQDIREKELQEQGYLKAEKVYFRIGRAIFVIDVIDKSFTEEEAIETPLGLTAKMNDPTFEFNPEVMNMLQNIFGSTGVLRVVVEGDDDCGFASNSEILITGYRGGLDDVIVDDKLLQTVHGSDQDIMRNFADELYSRAEWGIHVPRWETYDGTGYQIKNDKELVDEIKRLSGAIRDMAYRLDHKDDMPEEVRKKWEVREDEVSSGDIE